LPTSGLQQLRQYLGKRPHDEVAGLISMIEQCVKLQLSPGVATASADECTPVADQLRAEAKKVASAVEKQQKEDAEHEQAAIADALRKAKQPLAN